MSKKAFVPDKSWQDRLIAIYDELLESAGVQYESVTAHANGTVTLTLVNPADYDQIESNGVLIALTELGSANNVTVYAQAGEEFARNNDPFANRGKSRKKARKSLSPEEKAKLEIRRKIKARLQAGLDDWKAQADQRDDEPESDDEDEPVDYNPADEDED